MHYEELPAPPALQPFVRCLWRLTGEAGGSAHEASAEPALPDGSPELIFNGADPFEYVAPDGTVIEQPAAFLVGQITRPFTVRPTGRVDLLAVRFEAFGAAMLHDDLRQLTDRWAAVEHLPVPALSAIAAALRGTSSPDTRLARLHEGLSHVIASRPAPDARVVAAVQAIRASHGAVMVDELVYDLAMTPRTMQRLFARQVGISPKLLGRIVRFQRVFTAWRADPRRLARVAAECGYFDQSHLVRDFRDFAGAPPAGFLAELPAFTQFFVA